MSSLELDREELEILARLLSNEMLREQQPEKRATLDLLHRKLATALMIERAHAAFLYRRPKKAKAKGGAQ